MPSAPRRHRSDWLYARNLGRRSHDRGINPLATDQIGARLGRAHVREEAYLDLRAEYFVCGVRPFLMLCPFKAPSVYSRDQARSTSETGTADPPDLQLNLQTIGCTNGPDLEHRS